MPGLRFRKLDLHVHTPASRCYLHKDHKPAEIIQAAIDQELDGIAVVDHNTAEWIDEMKRAAQGTDLVVFPGVELSMSGGYHVVALFDPVASQKHVEGLLGAVRIKPEEFGNHDTLCTMSVEDVMTTIHKRDGLAILAHIDRPKGAFAQLSELRDEGRVGVPLPCRSLFNDEKYDAVECVDGCYPDGFDEAHHLTRSPAFYQASDNPAPGNPTRHSLEGIGQLHSWFKLDEINLEGLRQCFADPEVRIQQMCDYEPILYPKVVEMEVSGSGFLGSQTIGFHDGLNSIIGGKGVGKSLAIEFLRFGLGQPSTNTALASDHLSKIEDRLQEGNYVRLICQSADGGRYEVTRRFLGTTKTDRGDLIEDDCTCRNLDTGESYHGDIPTLFPILGYSQTEVIKIAEDPDAQLELIDRFLDTRTHEQRISEARRSLSDNDIELANAIRAKDDLEQKERDIATFDEQLRAINRSLSDPLFKEMQMAESKKSAFEGIARFVEGMIDDVSSWKEKTQGLSLSELPESMESDSDLAARQNDAEDARAKLQKALQTSKEDLQASLKSINDAEEAWLPEHEGIAAKYANLLEKLGGNKQAQERKRQRLQEQIAELQTDADQLRQRVTSLPEIEKDRQQVLNALEAVYRQKYELRKAKYDQFAALSEGRLELVLDHAVDRKRYEKALTQLLRGGGNALSTGDRRKIAANVMPRRLVNLVLDRDVAKLTEEAEITTTWASRAIEKLWSHDPFSDVLALQHDCFPADRPSIRFQKENGKYEDLSKLSVGQKCTALLIIALCDGTMPVIIDQPEDALDIVSVWEDIAQKLRRGKNSRQFILTTHNSSVAVAADSDQFIVLKADANRGGVVEVGAIDRSGVRAAVIAHLEGGDVPYLLRHRKYRIKTL